MSNDSQIKDDVRCLFSDFVKHLELRKVAFDDVLKLNSSYFVKRYGEYNIQFWAWIDPRLDNNGICYRLSCIYCGDRYLVRNSPFVGLYLTIPVEEFEEHVIKLKMLI